MKGTTIAASSRHLRAAYQNFSAGQVLGKPTSALLGVSESAANTLQRLGIRTVFDLAASSIFNQADELLRAAQGANAGLSRYGAAPRDILDDGPATASLPELAARPVSTLRAIPDDVGEALEQALNISSIREMALWPPYHAAQSIFSEAFGGNATPAFDPEMPPDLIPGTGQFPTERVQYEILLFDRFIGRMEADPDLIRLENAYQFDIAELLSASAGYQQPAIGAVLTYTQSWYTRGLALGNLIHSVALAPGESTRLAMIDWSRRTLTSATEDIDESEALVSDVARSRSINEITQAVARETQQGQSAASNFANASQRGESTGTAGLRSPSLLDVLDPRTGFASPRAETSGTSSSFATSFTYATSWSTSSGERDISAALAQDIVDRTHQESHLARRRRASIVREVSQSESERISTRAVTNYNHMHALTVQYYEVVQIYNAVVELTNAERCLFVPMRLIDFSQPRVVERFKAIISLIGLRSDVRALALADPDMLAIWAPTRTGRWDPTRLANASRIFGSEIGRADSPFLVFPTGFAFEDVVFEADVPFASLTVTLASGESVQLPLAAEPLTDVVEVPLIGRLHVASGSREAAAKLFGARLSDVRRITARKREDRADFEGEVVATLFQFSKDPRINGSFFPLSWPVRVSQADKDVVLLEVQPTASTSSLARHLQENQLYYSQGIWRALDPATIGILLSRYSWADTGQEPRSLAQLVDPTPVAVVANYLVFRLSGGNADACEEWLKNRQIIVGSRREDLIPVPSGGVFAEAVLGRFNSAEKLDITRFWNWQDSPIPIQAPEIAPVPAASRGEPDNTGPGQLGAPVLNIVNAPPLPDPQGLGAVLTAIQNGNIFRDMSGLSAAIGLAQAGLASAQQGATSAAGQAGQNAAVAAQLGAKLAEIAANLAAAALTGGASLATGGGVGALGGLANLVGGISGQGAKINQGADMDRRGVGGASDGSAGSTPGAASGGGDGSAGAAPEVALPNGQAASNEQAAFQSSLGGRGGLLGSVVDLILGQTGPQTGPRISLIGDPQGQLQLSQDIMDYLGTLQDPVGTSCVAASLAYFTGGCEALGVDTTTVNIRGGHLQIPSVATANGGLVSARNMLILWFSSSEADVWTRLPQAYRGAGAPGALLYADLVENRQFLTSGTGWPQGLLPGALLQLWPSEAEYENFRDRGRQPSLGHSCVFRRYISDGRIEIADQTRVAREVNYPLWRLRYVIGANLSRARLFTPNNR